MKIAIGPHLGLSAALAALVAIPAKADIYMHNPRGSNGRGCRNSNNAERSGDEAQRLFDSQNNDKGGYSCGATYPFACYTESDETARAACNAKNTAVTDEEGKALVNEDGTLKDAEAINTPKMYFYTGSVLPIEWTVQHGSGVNAKVHSDIVIQVACEESEPGVYSFTDDCGGDGTKVCQPRDGTAISNTDQVNTQRIAETPTDQDNYRYGRHESLRFYQRCRNLERNKGLWLADQNLNGNDARYTRQNPNGNRNGLECPEESEYYPYWQPSPWIDVAIVTGNPAKCEADKLESQNVQDKSYCDCKDCTGDSQLPNNERHCVEKGGVWKPFPAWNKRYAGVSAPECVVDSWSRDNHLGNVAGNGQPIFYNWTIPDYLAGKDKCVLRVRYNISTGDHEDVSMYGDSTLNGQQSPVQDRNNNPAKVYKQMTGICEGPACMLGLAVNTNQYGRTFQDRSHIFRVQERPAEPDCKKIFNLNVRGKRGNIVQTYPAVEYDFVPNVLVASEDDCIHVQWTGSGYNPNRNPNNAEGGPPNPNAIGESKSDRSNMVQITQQLNNEMILDSSQFSMFDAGPETYRRLAFLDQEIGNPEKCYPYSTLREINNNNNDATDRDYRNCMKLSGAVSPYFDAGLLKPRQGVHKYMSTRNNNFSNRGQKGVLIVEGGGPNLGGGTVVGVVLGSIAGAALLAFVALVLLPRRRRAKAAQHKTASGSSGPASTRPLYVKPAAPAGSTEPSVPSSFTATAMYAHTAKESGELSFAAGDKITVLHQDPSGWWEGRHESGAVGIFPSNFVSAPGGAQVAVQAV